MSNDLFTPATNAKALTAIPPLLGERAGVRENATNSRPVSIPELVHYKCRCGKLHAVQSVEHYDTILLSCGQAVFAIRRQRNGPLELIPSPTVEAQRQAREAEAQAEVDRLLHY